MMQNSQRRAADAGPLIGIIVIGLGTALITSVLTSSFDGRFIFGFIGGMLVALGTYLILPRRLREG